MGSGERNGYNGFILEKPRVSLTKVPCERVSGSLHRWISNPWPRLDQSGGRAGMGNTCGRQEGPKGRGASVTPGFKGQSRVHLIHAPKKTTYIITECIEINVTI
jgi:hypothetical protein